MVTIDIKSVQQILHKKITFGHTRCLSKKFKIVFESYVPHKNVVFFTFTYYGNTLSMNSQ